MLPRKETSIKRYTNNTIILTLYNLIIYYFKELVNRFLLFNISDFFILIFINNIKQFKIILIVDL